MRYFISRPGRVITYQDFGSDVWKDDYVREKTIQEGVNALKRELRELDLSSLADRIASDVQVGGTAPGAEGRLRSGARRMTLGLMRLALRHRDLLTGYLLPHLPAFEARMAAWHHRRRAGIEIRDLAATGETPQIFQGPIPGRQLRSLSDSRETLERRAEAVRELLRRAGWQAAPPSSQGVGS